LLAFLTLLFVVSCGDIVDSDENIKKTAVTYAKVLENQETGVILPLKVGNKWLYTVDEINENDLVFRKRADSIVVISEMTLDDGIWFEVYFPLISKKENVLMTNTEKGLWVRCEQCEDTSFLWAEYPYHNEFLYTGEKHYVLKDAGGNAIDENYITIGKTSQSAKITLSSGKEFETIKYEVFSINRNSAEHYLGDEYFVRDFGLVKAYNKPIFDMTGEIYEFSSNPVDEPPADTNDCRYYGSKNAGYIVTGDSKTLTVTITNMQNIPVNIVSMQILFDNPEDIIEIVSNNTLPLTLDPNSSIDISVKISPITKGMFRGFLVVRSDEGCWSNIQIYGEGY
jgi:hypothetical protein